MADPIQNLVKRYDELVSDIIGHLETLATDLKNEKSLAKKGRRINIYELHMNKKMELLAKKSEVEKAHEQGSGVTDDQKNKIISKYEAFENLIGQEMKLESGGAVTYESEQTRIAEEITAIDKLLNHIKENTSNKNKRFNLNTGKIQAEIARIDRAIISRELEQERTRKHNELKTKIHRSAGNLLKDINRALSHGP